MKEKEISEITLEWIKEHTERGLMRMNNMDILSLRGADKIKAEKLCKEYIEGLKAKINAVDKSKKSAAGKSSMLLGIVTEYDLYSFDMPTENLTLDYELEVSRTKDDNFVIDKRNSELTREIRNLVLEAWDRLFEGSKENGGGLIDLLNIVDPCSPRDSLVKSRERAVECYKKIAEFTDKDNVFDVLAETITGEYWDITDDAPEVWDKINKKYFEHLLDEMSDYGNFMNELEDVEQFEHRPSLSNEQIEKIISIAREKFAPEEVENLRRVINDLL